MHDREILQRCDDSVDGHRRRRAAAHSPRPRLCPARRSAADFDVRRRCSPSAAISKTSSPSPAAASPTRASISAILKTSPASTSFRESLDHLMRTFEIEPQAVVHDLHPGYLSTNWAKEWAAERGLPLIAVQHHHAHIAACMAEHALDGRSSASRSTAPATEPTAASGAGKCSSPGSTTPILPASSASRISTTCPCPAAKRPFASRGAWRSGHLHAAGFDVESPEVIALLGAKPQEARVLKRMIERELNTPLTSSWAGSSTRLPQWCSRRGVVDYEAQAAIELEGLAVDEPDDLDRGYSFEFSARRLVEPGADANLRRPNVARAAAGPARCRSQIANRRALSRGRCLRVHSRRNLGSHRYRHS